MTSRRESVWYPVITAVLVVATGLSIAVVRYRTVEAFTHNMVAAQSTAAVQSLQSFGIASKAEAQLLAAGGLVGSSARDLRYTSKIVETSLVSSDKMASGTARVIRLLRGNGGPRILSDDARVPIPLGLRSGEGGTSLTSPPQPARLLMFEVGDGGVVICSVASLADVAAMLSRATSGYLEFEFTDQTSRRKLFSSSGWAAATSEFELSSPVEQPAPLLLHTRPSALLLTETGASHVVAIILTTLMIGGFAYLFAKDTQTAARSLCMVTVEESLATGRYKSNLDAMLTSVSDASGAMFFLLRPNSHVDLFGPWSEIDDLGRTSIALADINRSVIGADAISRSLLTALTGRTSWVYTYRVATEQEPELYQAAGAPIFSPNGEFIGLLGVRTNVSEVVRAVASSSKTEAVRSGQEVAIQGLSDALSVDLHSISKSLACLAASVEKGDAGAVAHWMVASTDAGARIDALLQAAILDMKGALRANKPELGASH